MSSNYAASLDRDSLITYISDLSKEVHGSRWRGFTQYTRDDLLRAATLLEVRLEEAAARRAKAAQVADGGGSPDAPRIMECESDWKVSPHGDAHPDRECYWVDTYEEALDEIADILGL